MNITINEYDASVIAEFLVENFVAWEDYAEANSLKADTIIDNLNG